MVEVIGHRHKVSRVKNLNMKSPPRLEWTEAQRPQV